MKNQIQFFWALFLRRNIQYAIGMLVIYLIVSILCIKSAFAASPIQISAPSAGSVWVTGNGGMVNWTPGVGNSSSVRVQLSTDGGATYSILLSASTPNDGSETFTVPNLPTQQARIRIEGIGATGSANATPVFKIQASLGVVATPVITPSAGSISIGANVMIATSTPGAIIYYTLNGNNPVPGTSFTYKFVGSFAITNSTTIKAIAVRMDFTTSGIATSAITVAGNPPLAPSPAISPSTGTFSTGQMVTLSSPIAGATIYYTTNGNNPLIGSTFTRVYTAPFFMPGNGTVRAIVAASGFANSMAAAAFYTVLNPTRVAAPVISPGTGTFSNQVSVSISCATPGSIIYYTTNGNEPVVGTPYTRMYTSAFPVGISGSVWAIAVKANMVQSVSVSTYLTIQNPIIVATPTISKATGTYQGAQQVSMNCTTPGATIYYTTSGNLPVVGTGFTKVYTGPFVVAGTQTVRAIAVKNGLLNSIPATSFITIIGTNGRANVSELDESDILPNSEVAAVVFPNPTTGRFQLKTGASGWAQVQVLNISGATLKKFILDENNSNVLDISDLNPGVYLVTIATDSKIQTVRVIKN